MNNASAGLQLATSNSSVLVVDDDPVTLLQLKRQVEKLVSTVMTASDGEQGLKLWRSHHPDVVVTDLLMPKMNGLEMSTLIRQEDDLAQIIVVTSDEDLSDLRRAIEIGVERYIHKPIDGQLLNDAISKCIRDKVATNELFLSRKISRLTEELKLQLAAKEETELALKAEKQEQAELITKLEDAHNQLLQSEKMAAIGQLAAGVAHEINNPIGFINSNIGVLQKYVDAILNFIEFIEQNEINLPKQIKEEFDNRKKILEIDYLKSDIRDLLAESLDGLQRVKKIVSDLKDFSHANSDMLEFVDLHSKIESTLNVVWNEIKYKANVIRDYGNIPEIECNPSQVNQVIMNLLVNAAQSIAEHGDITIRTRLVNSSVKIEIIDTGSGISPENIRKVFDPFFTTKPIGVGTGLGLSISSSIVRKHHGELGVTSEIGKGSCFYMILPIKQSVPGKS